MIAPCKCRGSIKWVHRECLDMWRSVSSNPKAFGACTTCNEPYYYEAVSGVSTSAAKLKMALLILRDYSLVIVVVGFIALFPTLLGAIFTYWMDSLLEFTADYLPELHSSILIYTVFLLVAGLTLFFAMIGLIGSIVLLVRALSKNSRESRPYPGPYYYSYGTWYWYWDMWYWMVLMDAWSTPAYGPYYGPPEGPCICNVVDPIDCCCLTCGSCIVDSLCEKSCGTGSESCINCVEDGCTSLLARILIVVAIYVVVFAILGVFFGFVFLVLILWKIAQLHANQMWKRIAASQTHRVMDLSGMSDEEIEAMGGGRPTAPPSDTDSSVDEPAMESRKAAGNAKLGEKTPLLYYDCESGYGSP
jgi:hypothetical protein